VRQANQRQASHENDTEREKTTESPKYEGVIAHMNVRPSSIDDQTLLYDANETLRTSPDQPTKQSRDQTRAQNLAYSR